jgi:phage-related tail protein
MEKTQALIDAVKAFKSAKEYLKEVAEDFNDGRVSAQEVQRQTHNFNDKWDDVVTALGRL